MANSSHQANLFDDAEDICASPPAISASGRGSLDEPTARGLLDQLLADSKLYRSGKDYQYLLQFIGRLRGFAPFNAMLLDVQKSGLSYAASARDWRERFGRFPKEGARPLLIMWPFGPVATVYDVLDTEGRPLPEDVFKFVATGSMDLARLQNFRDRLSRRRIECKWVDKGDRAAGSIRVVRRPALRKNPSTYRIVLNGNHAPAVQFVTLAHELGHLFLGHLGVDKYLDIPRRKPLRHDEKEIEAESIAFIVSERIGIKSKSHPYLSKLVGANSSAEDIDIFQVMRAAGQVESLLGVSPKIRYDKPEPR